MALHAMPDLPEQQATESATVAALEAAGYDCGYEIIDGRLSDGTDPVEPGRLVVDRTYRFEGASDPDYQSLVLALRDPESGHRGVLVTAYGPTASAAEAAVLRHLTDDPRHSH
jgi:hypothetical protein